MRDMAPMARDMLLPQRDMTPSVRDMLLTQRDMPSARYGADGAVKCCLWQREIKAVLL